VLPAPVMVLLGESLAAASLLAASLKFQGTLTLQVGGSAGRVSMLVAQATDTRTMRGVAHVATDSEVSGDSFNDLINGGRLVVTVEQGAGRAPWQGIVPLDGRSLAASLEKYFAVSEQLPTAIVLAADAERAVGLLLQKMPTPIAHGEMAGASVQDVWEEATMLLATLRPEELLNWEPDVLLQRLFAERDLRLFDSEPMRFACRCDRERVGLMLVSLGQADVEALLAEQGAATITCEFCQKPYRFDAVDAARLFLPGAAGASESVN
jgi:molecular chaperone Hsp33